MKTTLLLLLLIGASFAYTVTTTSTTVTTTGTCITNATDIIFTEQGTNIILVLALIGVLIACAYAVGSAMGNANYIVFAKDEAYHLGFSIGMLLFFSGILVFACMLMDFFYQSSFSNLGAALTAPGSTQCYYEGRGINSLATCYMDAMKSEATSLSEYYIKQHIGLLMDSTFSWSVQYPLLDAYTLTAGAYKRIVSSEYDIILNTFLVPTLMSISMQKLMLDFITENAVRWILPIAFLLRVFPPTRQMGNIFIALVLGIYVVIPFMYVFNLSMYDVTLEDCHPFANAVCDAPMDNYDCANGGGTCDNVFGFWHVARLIPQAFFLPNLTIAIVVTFLGCIHKALRVIG